MASRVVGSLQSPLRAVPIAIVVGALVAVVGSTVSAVATAVPVVSESCSAMVGIGMAGGCGMAAVGIAG